MRDVGPESGSARDAGCADVEQHVLVHQRGAELGGRDQAEHGLDLPRSSWRVVDIRATISADEGETNVTAPLTGYADRIRSAPARRSPSRSRASGPAPTTPCWCVSCAAIPTPPARRPRIEDESELFDGRFASREQRCLARLLCADRGRQGHQAARRALRRGTDLADAAGGRAADRNLAPRSSDRRGLCPGIDARRHGAGERHGARGHRQEAPLARLVPRMGERRPGDRRAARRPAAA